MNDYMPRIQNLELNFVKFSGFNFFRNLLTARNFEPKFGTIKIIVSLFNSSILRHFANGFMQIFISIFSNGFVTTFVTVEISLNSSDWMIRTEGMFFDQFHKKIDKTNFLLARRNEPHPAL